MPWSNQGGGNGGGWQSGRPKGPWGQGPGGPGRQPPDLEEILKKGQDRLKDFIPGGGGSQPIFWIGLLVLVGVFWAWRSFYTVQSDEVGIELLFGKAKQEENLPGLHFRMWPVESVERPPALRENKENIGFGVNGTRSGATDSLMLAGDQNIVDIQFTVLWRIADPRAYLFNVANQAELIRVVAESAMREHVGRNPAEVIRTTGRVAAQDAVSELIQHTIDGYKAGVEIIGVRIERADPPPAVNDAFEEVQRAKQDQDKYIEEAQKYSNRRLGQARGEAAKIREEAEAYKGRVVAEATGEAQRFLQVFEEYKKAKTVTRQRLFLETLEGVYSRSNKVIIEGKDGSGVVPYLPLPEIQKRSEKAAQGGQQ